MISEEQIIKSVTDKLIEVAKHPEMRKEFLVTVKNTQIYCYKNTPLMCDIDRYVLSTYYACLLALYAKTDDDLTEFFNKSLEHINQMVDSIDLCNAMAYLYAIVSQYFQKQKGLSDEISFLVESFLYSADTPEGVTIEDIRKLRSLAKKDPNNVPLYEFLSDIDSYFKEFEKKLDKEDNPEQSWPEYAQKAISDINEKCLASFEEDIASEDEEEDRIEPDRFAKIILQAYKIIEPPKRKSPRKGEFDYYYNKAEKGDPEAQRIIADAYRNGDVVTKNERLANFWQAIADEHRYIE